MNLTAEVYRSRRMALKHRRPSDFTVAMIRQSNGKL